MTARALISASPVERWQRVRDLLRQGREHDFLARTASRQRDRSAAAGRKRTAEAALVAELTALEQTGVLAFVGHIIWSNWGSGHGDL